MKRVYLHPLPLRVWHWANALLVLLLIVTGTLMRISGVPSLGPRHPALWIHRYAGWAMVASACLTLAGVHGLVWLRDRAARANLMFALLAGGTAGMAAGGIHGRDVSREDLPPIWDVQTDWTRPVAFTEATLKARSAAGAVRVRDDALVLSETIQKALAKALADSVALADEIRSAITKSLQDLLALESATIPGAYGTDVVARAVGKAASDTVSAADQGAMQVQAVRVSIPAPAWGATSSTG